MHDYSGPTDHLRELGNALDDWERYRPVGLEELRTDRDTRNMVMHAMLVSIQTSIDIANHLVADRGTEKPSTYRESFELLADNGLIERELADELADLAGFRNVLVHMYVKLDLEQVHGVLENDCVTLRRFEKRVKELLGEEGKG